MNLQWQMIAILNIFFWPIVQIGISYLVLKIPIHFFSSHLSLSQVFPWEKNGDFYRMLQVHRFKNFLPDGQSFFPHAFSKKKIRSRDIDYLNNFLAETSRGEFAHWLMIACTPLTIFWNPPWAIMVMAIAGLVLNLPCIVASRYNRIIIQRILRRRKASQHLKHQLRN